MSSSKPTPRHVVCVLGTWKNFAAVNRAVARADGFSLDTEFSILESDDRMQNAFAACADRVDPSMTKQDLAAIDRHTAVAYIMSPPLRAARTVEMSGRMLAIIDELLDGGALAVKSESAGVAHGAKRWRDLAERARSTDLLERTTGLRLAFVRRPIAFENILYSCGMHLLGERDIEVDHTDDPLEDVGWIDLVATYLLAEKPERGVHDGEGFRQVEGGERRILRSRECDRYEPDEFFYNPYGYWRLTSSASAR